MASNTLTLSVRRSGAAGFDVTVRVNENPALQDLAMEQLDKLLFVEENMEWLESIWPWAITYEVGISIRHFAGSQKEGQTLVNKWMTNCKKLCKDFSIVA